MRKIIVAGGRDFEQYGMLKRVLIQHGITKNYEIVSGCARGADSLGEKFANYIDCKLTKFPAEWNRYGKSAGPIRNSEMADYADEAIVFWNGVSSGSKDMIDKMKLRGKPVKVVRY